MSLELRPITSDEVLAFAATIGAAFGWTVDTEDMSFWDNVVEIDRTLAAFDGDRIVGTAGAFTFQMTLPGEVSAATAGVSFVSVLPTHRRRGVLSAMMRQQLDDVCQRGEPLAILLASESVIYGRFGYGLGTTQVDYEIERRFGALRWSHGPLGVTSILSKEQARALLPPVYERVRLSQPGFVNRTDAWWDMRMTDRERDRDGASQRFYAVYERDGEPEGYVAYRVKGEWPDGIARSEVRVADFMAATPDAYVGLWQYLMSLDLMQRIRFDSRPIDEPVRWMLADPRHLRFSTVNDHLWTRLVDVSAALESRRYGDEGAVTFAVEDRFYPQNTGNYRLEGGPDGATCRRTDADPDLALRVDDLGATFLGGVSFRTLTRAGRVEECCPGATRRADTLFDTGVAPWCANHF